MNIIEIAHKIEEFEKSLNDYEAITNIQINYLHNETLSGEKFVTFGDIEINTEINDLHCKAEKTYKYGCESFHETGFHTYG